MLTPIEIHNKEFNKRMRGYDVDEVNQFLDEVGRDYEKVLEERKSLEEELEEAYKQLDQYLNIEDSLNKSIVVAQQTADQLKESSQKEADMIIAEAQNSADHLLKDAVEKANMVAEETDELRRQSSIFRERLQLMLETQIELVKNEDWDQLLKTSSLSEGNFVAIESLNREFAQDNDENYEPDFEPIYEIEEDCAE